VRIIRWPKPDIITEDSRTLIISTRGGTRGCAHDENVEMTESPKTKSVSSTELCLCEVKDEAAPGVALWWLDYLNGFLVSPVSAVRASVHDRREWTKGSRGRKQWVFNG
jgi:hypothetical protein